MHDDLAESRGMEREQVHDWDHRHEDRVNDCWVMDAYLGALEGLR